LAGYALATGRVRRNTVRNAYIFKLFKAISR
jgi:hypothetical protein